MANSGGDGSDKKEIFDRILDKVNRCCRKRVEINGWIWSKVVLYWYVDDLRGSSLRRERWSDQGG